MILVTGASQGIGWACARELLARTAGRVTITGRDEERLQAARASLPESLRARLATRASDQASRRDVLALAERIARDEEPLDGAILSVGVNPMYSVGPQRLHALDPSVVEATILVNCTHTTLLTTAVLERMRRQRAGVLVWIGSLATRVGLPGAGLYCATKTFLSGLARAAHIEYRNRGVRVHLAHPGIVRTPRTAGVAEEFARAHGYAVSEADAVGRRIVDLMLAGRDDQVEVELC